MIDYEKQFEKPAYEVGERQTYVAKVFKLDDMRSWSPPFISMSTLCRA